MTDLEHAIQTVRFLAVDAVEKANSGHPGAPMGLATVGVELFTQHLRFDPQDPNWPNRDRFILSCGHASALLYSLLHLAGYDLSLEDLQAFRQWGSKTPGHPEVGHTPGVETTTGPLGQGIGNAVGLALASKMAGARVNAADNALIDYRVFVVASDGDLMEGVAREAASLAGHLGLENLVVIYDDNRITIDGSTEIAFTDDVQKCFEGYGWSTEAVDGHDALALRGAINRALTASARPSLIRARTHIGFGSPGKQDKAACHGSPLGKAELSATKAAAGWPDSPMFRVTPESYAPFKARVVQNQAERAAWLKQFDRASAATKEVWAQLVERKLPSDALEQLIVAAGTKALATRRIANQVQQKAAELMPAIVGGSADLACSVMSTLYGAGNVGKADFSGKNLHFGVREHGMSAILNGLSLSGFFVPYGSTFLIFSDYMRPGMRLSALMERQVVYLFSHDTVYLGEDGPTHQPVEQLSTLRLVPNLHLFRPADPMECAAAWYHAMTRSDGPTALVLSRQDLPVLERPASFEPRTVLKGAYVVSDVEKPELVLIATGSEVGVAIEAKAILAASGRRIRVISAPCWELFRALPKAEREALLTPGVPRAVFEIGSTAVWQGVVGEAGLVIGHDAFGISAPWQRIQQELGFDAATVAARLAAHYFA